MHPHPSGNHELAMHVCYFQFSQCSKMVGNWIPLLYVLIGIQGVWWVFQKKGGLTGDKVAQAMAQARV